MVGNTAGAHKLALVLLITLLGLAGCHAGTPPRAGNATITVNDDTGPVGGASVILNGQTETTNAEGQVSFSNVPAGDYSVTVTKSGYASALTNITITGGKTATATVTLSRQFGSATITVTDGTNPVGGASVTLNGFTATTDDTLGQAAFSNVPVGVHPVTAAKSGYTSGSADITIAEGETATATVTLTRQYGSATITVRDSAGTVEGASVTLNSRTNTTDDRGQTTFNDMPVGDYTVAAAKSGYTSGSANISITAGETATATVMLIRQTGSATIIVNVGTNPLSGASVTLNGQTLTTTLTTNASGAATFTNVPTGVYTVTVAKDGYHTKTASITVTEGETATATISTTIQTGNVSVWVLEDPSYIHLTGASVTMAGRTVTANVDGRYDFADVPTGTYPATASCANYATATINVTVTDDHGLDPECGYGSQIIFLKKFVAGQIIVTMLDKNGSPVSGVTVEIWLKSDPSVKRTGTTNVSGQVALTDVVAGLWRINASSSQPGYWIPYGMDFTVTATDVAFTFSVPFWPS